MFIIADPYVVIHASLHRHHPHYYYHYHRRHFHRHYHRHYYYHHHHQYYHHQRYHHHNHHHHQYYYHHRYHHRYHYHHHVSQADIDAHLTFKEEQKEESQQTPILDSLPVGTPSTPIILSTPTKNRKNETDKSPKSETDKRSGVVQTPISNKKSPFSPRTLLRSVSESDLFNRNTYVDIDMDLSRYEDDNVANEFSNSDDADVGASKPSMKSFIRTR
jgi:hypothetical protein